MIKSISEQAFVFVAFVALLILLWIGASIRIRHDRKLKHRAKVNRRDKHRAEPDRRWSTRD